MTVKELREVLASFDDDAPVLVSSYEGDRYDTAQKVDLIQVYDRGEDTKKEEWWTGRYGPGDEADKPWHTFFAVVIPR